MQTMKVVTITCRYMCVMQVFIEFNLMHDGKVTASSASVVSTLVTA